MATNRAYSHEVGKRIEQLRKQHQMTQAELARFLGVSQQTVFSMELGDRSVQIERVPTLSRIFGVTSDTLLGLASIPKARSQRISPQMARHVADIQQLSNGDRKLVLRLATALSQVGR